MFQFLDINFTLSIWFIIYVIIITCANFFELSLRPKIKNSDKSGKLSLMIFFFMFLTIVTITGFFLLTDSTINILWFVIGHIIFIGAFTFRFFGVKKMKKNYSQYIAPLPEATLLTNGMYSIVRHPNYLFYTLQLSGLMLIRPNFITFFCLIIDTIATIIRIKNEEKLLVAKFPEYKEYQKNTKMLIPFLY